MDFPKYDGNIHPDEWITDIKKYFKLRKVNGIDCFEIVMTSVNPIISLPAEADSLEKFCSILREDISFAVFKNTNERMFAIIKIYT
jgi:hypothetical protein